MRGPRCCCWCWCWCFTWSETPFTQTFVVCQAAQTIILICAPACHSELERQILKLTRNASCLAVVLRGRALPAGAASGCAPSRLARREPLACCWPPPPPPPSPSCVPSRAPAAAGATLPGSSCPAPPRPMPGAAAGAAIGCPLLAGPQLGGAARTATSSSSRAGQSPPGARGEEAQRQVVGCA